MCLVRPADGFRIAKDNEVSFFSEEKEFFYLVKI